MAQPCVLEVSGGPVAGLGLGALEALLLQATRPDTAAVKAAERALGAALREPRCVPALLQLLRFSAHAGVRQLAAVLLRLRLAQQWPALEGGERVQAKALLLDALANERERVVSLNVTYVVSALSKLELEGGAAGVRGWSELLEFLQRFAQSAEPAQQELAMRLLYALTDTVGTVFQPHLAELKVLYEAALAPSRDARVRVAALKAAGALIDFLSSSDDVLLFRELVPLLLEGLEQAAQPHGGDDALAVQLLEVLSQLAESPVPVLNKLVRPCVRALLRVVSSADVDAGVRQAAVQTLCSILQCKARFVAKVPGGVQQLLDAAIACLVIDFSRFVQVLREQDLSQAQLEERRARKVLQLARDRGGGGGGGDDDDDNDDDNDDDAGCDEDEDGACDAGQSLVAAITMHLPPRLVFRPLLEAAAKRIEAGGVAGGAAREVPNQWVGLSLLLHSTEGLAEQLAEKKVLAELIKRVLPIAQRAADPILRATALMCLAEWVQHLVPDIWSFMPTMLPEAIALLGDTSSILVRSCAGDVVELICDEIEESLLLPYLGDLVAKLLLLAQPGAGTNATMQWTALSALSSTMTTCGANFMPFFDTTCRVLAQLAQLTDGPMLVVRGHAIAALGNLALACSRPAVAGGAGSNLFRFRPLVAELLHQCAAGLALHELELNAQTYRAIGTLAEAFGQELDPAHGELMIRMLADSRELDDDEHVNVRDPDGALISDEVRDQFAGDETAQAPQPHDERPRWQPGVRYELSIRMEAVEAKQAAMYALGRFAEFAPAHLTALHVELELDACAAALAHVHPELKVEAAGALAQVVLAFARAQPAPELGAAERELAAQLALGSLCEAGTARRWLPGWPARTPLGGRDVTAVVGKAVGWLLRLGSEDRDSEPVAACLQALEGLVNELGPAALAVSGGADGWVSQALQLCMGIFQGKAACQHGGESGEQLSCRTGSEAAAARDDEGGEEEEEGDDDGGGDDDDDDEVRSGVELFESACDLVGAIALALGRAFQPLVVPLFGVLARRAARDKGRRRAAAVGALVQVLVALGAPLAAEPFVEDLLPLALSCLAARHCVTRQNAAFLCGNLVLFGGPKVQRNTTALVRVLRELEPLLEQTREADALVAAAAAAGEDEDAIPYEVKAIQAVADNACGAVARVLAAGALAGALPAERVLPQMLGVLPLRRDLSENLAVFRCVATLLELGGAARQCVLERAAQLVGVCARTLKAMEAADTPQELAREQLSSVLAALRAGHPQATQDAVSRLPAPLQAALSAVWRRDEPTAPTQA